MILFAERIQSLFRTGGEHLFFSGFGIYVNILTMMSLPASVVLLASRNRRFWSSLVNRSVAPVQFIAYGMIIVAMVPVPYKPQRGEGGFPMVVFAALSYGVFHGDSGRLSVRNDHAVWFYIVEAAVSLALVLCFTMLLRQVMTGNGADLLRWFPMLIVAVGATVIFAMQWKESVNTFVLIFAALSVFLFVAGKIIFGIRKKGGNES